MTWTENEFPFGSILTSSKMTNLQNNFQAMAEGDNGAPEIKQASLSPGVMGGFANGVYGSLTLEEQYRARFFYDGTADFIQLIHDGRQSVSGYGEVLFTINSDQISQVSSVGWVTFTNCLGLASVDSGTWAEIVVETDTLNGAGQNEIKNFAWYVGSV